MPYRDIEKKRKYEREYMRTYSRNRYASDPAYRQSVKDKTKRRYLIVKAAIEPILSEFRKNGCFLCGEMSSCCLVAHHRNPEDKEYEIASLISSSRNIEKVTALLVSELKKCVCLCHNCHSKVHAGVQELY